MRKRQHFTPINAATAKEFATRPRHDPLTQAVAIQRALHDTGLLIAKDAKQAEDKTERARIACALASVAKGWESMQDQVRILRGKPLPGSLRPERPVKVKKPRPVPVEADTPAEAVETNTSETNTPTTRPPDELPQDQTKEPTIDQTREGESSNP